MPQHLLWLNWLIIGKKAPWRKAPGTRTADKDKNMLSSWKPVFKKNIGLNRLKGRTGWQAHRFFKRICPLPCFIAPSSSPSAAFFMRVLQLLHLVPCYLKNGNNVSSCFGSAVAALNLAFVFCEKSSLVAASIANNRRGHFIYIYFRKPKSHPFSVKK